MFLFGIVALCSTTLMTQCQMAYDTWPNDPTLLQFVACTSQTDPSDCVSADAGIDDLAPINVPVALDARGSTASFAPETITYSWTQLENGAPSVVIFDADQALASFQAQEPAVYRFQVATSWNCRTDTDEVEVMANLYTPTQVNAELVISRSSDTAVQVTHAPDGDSRLFIVYKSGRIDILQNDTPLADPFLDISPLVSSSSEQGLLGLAFDPDFTNNGIIYVNYTGLSPAGSGSSWDTRIVAWQVDPQNPNRIDPDSHFLLMSIDQPQTNHNGGQILFGSDGFLYIGTGDGGGGGDDHGTIGNGQDPSTLLGKMLRIDVSGLAPYSIPPDNPFVGDPTTLDEIWALGFRNPWRFSFDRQTGDLYIADVGQNEWEEINVQPSDSPGGENYGWRLKEGLACFNPSTGCDPGGLTDPIHVYSHGGNPFRCSITGGYVYRGSSVPTLNGFYLFGDYCSSQIWTLKNQHSGWEAQLLEVYVQNNLLSESVIAFGEDHLGDVYICTRGGSANVYRIISER